MNLQPLTVGNFSVPIPIIQGGMAVRISTANLAAAVANEGGIGIIAGTGMSTDELRNEIRKARSMTRGRIGVNVLFAVTHFAELVQTAMDEGIDLIISGAGFSRDMFKWGRETNTPIVPVVSSLRFAQLAERFGAAAVVVEGKEAGGHLGTEEPLFDILPEIVEKLNIPVIAAGGIIDGYDIVRALNMGASGVQMGTRFAGSKESNASDEMKEMYIRATEGDVCHILSPVGYPGQGITSVLTEAVAEGTYPRVKVCRNCLKKCTHRDSRFKESFCISEALEQACTGGDQSKALMFSGEHVHRIKEILPVRDIFRNLYKEIKHAEQNNAMLNV
ncbi:MAG: NAD(P)H-dependent flavin oxidoreductase [Bacilli bacterium]